MKVDPIVEEVRAAGAELAKECGYSVHRYAMMLKKVSDQRTEAHSADRRNKSGAKSKTSAKRSGLYAE